MLVLVDLDGTLADTSQRAHMLARKPRDWKAYSLACVDDDPIGETVQIVQSLALDHFIALVTGRHEVAREETEGWLLRHGVPYDGLYMRPEGDLRPNPEVKETLFELALGDSDDRPSAKGGVIVVDDHPGVAEHFNALGHPALVLQHPTRDQGIAAEVGVALPGPVAEALAEARDTFARKNADYAADDAWRSNFDAIAGQMGFGAVTAADTLIAVKQARLQALAANGREPANEAVIDTYLDRMVYGIIAYALLLDDAARKKEDIR